MKKFHMLQSITFSAGNHFWNDILSDDSTSSSSKSFDQSELN